MLLNKSDKGSGQTTRRVANGSTIFSPPFQFISSEQWLPNWVTRTGSVNLKKCQVFSKLAFADIKQFNLEHSDTINVAIEIQWNAINNCVKPLLQIIQSREMNTKTKTISEFLRLFESEMFQT